MSHLRAPAARADRREGGRHGRPASRTAPALPETHIRPQLLRLAVLPPVAVARRVVLLADSSKYGQEHFARFGSLSDVDLLITDSGLSPEDATAVERDGTEVVCA